MRRIAVFAKAPVPGRVKTRLLPALSPALACDLYRAMLADALEAAGAADADERWIYWADEPGPGPWPVPRGFGQRLQRGSNLGARLENACNELLLEGSDRVLILGADCPMLDATRLRKAFTALDAHDLVLGPACDGGYYLVGLRRRAPTLFHDISWSTDRVLDQTLAHAAALNLVVRALDPLEDVDTPQDLVRWLGQLVTTPASPSLHSLETLRGLGLLPPM